MIVKASFEQVTGRMVESNGGRERRIVHMVERVLRHGKGHHGKRKIDIHCVTLEAELGPVGGIYRSQLVAQYGKCLFNTENCPTM